MKVGDLIRHQMYSESKAPSIVLGYDKKRKMIRIFNPDDGGQVWFISREAYEDYEVISEQGKTREV